MRKGFTGQRRIQGFSSFSPSSREKSGFLRIKGIYEKMNQETLNRFANEVSRGVREGRACEVLSQAIQEIGVLLSQHFPITPDDTDELPDDVMTEE